MTGSVVAIITAVPVILLLGVNVFQTIIWTRRESTWQAERTRLLDTIVSHNAAEFRVRQTTKALRLSHDEDEGEPRHAAPNERPHRPMPIGLGGDIDAG